MYALRLDAMSNEWLRTSSSNLVVVVVDTNLVMILLDTTTIFLFVLFYTAIITGTVRYGIGNTLTLTLRVTTLSLLGSFSSRLSFLVVSFSAGLQRH